MPHRIQLLPADAAGWRVTACVAAGCALVAALAGPLLDPDRLPLVWPLFGTTVAALVCVGLQHWPAVALAFLLRSALRILESGDVDSARAVRVVVGSCLATALTLAVAAIVRRAVGDRSPLQSVRGINALLLGGLAASLPAALLLSTLQLPTWPTLDSHPALAIFTLWGAALLSLIVPAYPLIAWWHRELPAPAHASFEFCALVAGFALIGGVVFLGWFAAPLTEPSLRQVGSAFALFAIPLFLWAAIRFGAAGCSTGLLLVSVFSFAGDRPGIRDAFAIYLDPWSATTHLTIWLAGVAGIYVAAISQRLRQTADELLASREGLEQTVADRTAELARANSELAVEIERRKRAHQIARIGHWEWDLASDRIFYSEEMCRMLGFGEGPQTLPVGTDHRLVREADERAPIDAVLADAVRSQRPFELDFRFRDPVRGMIAIESRGDPVFDASGAMIGFSGTAQDVTARYELEERLRQGQKLEALGRLAGGVAHDFNNLLTPINGYAEHLAQALAGTGLATDAREIQRAGERATRLVRQLLAFGRGQAAPAGLVDLNQSATDMLSMLRPALGAGIDLQVDLARSLPRVRAEQDQLDQILLNLVVNARDALPRGGRIRVSTRRELQREPPGEERCFALLCVEDDGEGISEAAREHLFEPFFTTKGVGQGTGLGLATVYGIVQQAGGQIRVDSRPGEGARFEVLLPSEAGAAAPLEIAEDGAERSVGSETLLLVDDERSVRGLVRKLLERRGYRVLEAVDPRSALALARSERGPIDLLLTDVVMPGGSGTDLAREFRRERPGVPVLFMSGHATRDLREALEKDGGHMLSKPFSSARLLASVRRCLDAAGATPA